MASLIDLDDISRSFGPVQALAHVKLQLEPGTIGLVGNNGAGKSTMLKVLLGLLRPDSGRGSILGCDLRHAPSALRGRIGYMPEAHATVPVLRGVEFVTLSGDLYGMPHRDARRRAHEVLNYVGLGELRYRRLEEYSAGNIQRLKLAAALVHDPDLLLLDEPTNGLDPDGRRSMLQLLDDLIAETGKSVVLCTHLLPDVERLCQQIVVLHKGRVIQSGSMDSLRSVVNNRIHLEWRGDGSDFVARLRAAGADVVAGAHANRVVVETPDGWRNARFFELASSCGVVVTELCPDEENLERLFFRVTSEPANEAPRPLHELGAAHGH